MMKEQKLLLLCMRCARTFCSFIKSHHCMRTHNNNMCVGMKNYL